jgi:hypothetical protein
VGTATTGRTARSRWAARPTSARGVRATATAGVGAVALPLVLSLALGACSPAEPGAAAVVGDQRITTAQVNQAVRGIRQGNPEIAQGQGLDQTVLFYLLVAPYLLPRAEQVGAGVSDTEAAAQLPKATDPDPQSLRVLRTFLSLQKLQQGGQTAVLQQVQQQIRGAKARINPRFGQLDTTRLEIVERRPNWLVPAPSATASGQPTAPTTP